MIKLANIKEINTDFVLLKLGSKSQCTDCKSRCSDGFLSFLFHKNNQGELSVALNKYKLKDCHLYDTQHYFSEKTRKTDEVVGINFDESQLFKMALYLYGLPIISIIVFLMAGYFIFSGMNLNSDLGGIIGLMAGLVFAKFIIQLINKNIKPKVKFFN